MTLPIASSYEGMLGGLWVMAAIVAGAAGVLWVALRKWRVLWTTPILIVNALMLWPAFTISSYLVRDMREPGDGSFPWTAMACSFVLATLFQAFLVVAGSLRIIRLVRKHDGTG